MLNHYAVVLSKTCCNKGEYDESMYDYYYTTYEEALDKYDELVASESKHISGLTFVKCDATIVVYDKSKQIRRRVRIAN